MGCYAEKSFQTFYLSYKNKSILPIERIMANFKWKIQTLLVYIWDSK